MFIIIFPLKTCSEHKVHVIQFEHKRSKVIFCERINYKITIVKTTLEFMLNSGKNSVSGIRI